jgi:hypothetical protein
MRSERPPVLASWLLERFCPDPGLSGDLLEEYGRGRSALWYSKQAVVAVSAYPFSQILEHKWLAARAIAIGYVIWYVFNATLLRGVLRPWIGMDSTLDRAMYFVIGYALWTANGWIIAKLHRPYSTAMVLAYVLWSAAASVQPIYALVMNTIDGTKDGSALAFEVAARVGVLLFLMSGGALSTYRDQMKQTPTAHGWRGESPRAFAG